jgi:G:T-mismatch repair DNA endonuclease (very short patch repair protein)
MGWKGLQIAHSELNIIVISLGSIKCRILLHCCFYFLHPLQAMVPDPRSKAQLERLRADCYASLTGSLRLKTRIDFGRNS